MCVSCVTFLRVCWSLVVRVSNCSVDDPCDDDEGVTILREREREASFTERILFRGKLKTKIV